MSEEINVYQSRYTPLRISTIDPDTREFVNISGAALTFEIKLNLNMDATALVTKQNAAAGGGGTGIVDIDLTSGIYKVNLESEDVSGLGTFWCETKMVSGTKPVTIFGPRKLVVHPSLVS